MVNIHKKINEIIYLKRLGFDIIPAYPESAGEDYYKKPRIKIKGKPALTEEELIEWFTRRPTDLVGIRTNKWFSIDVDTEEHASGENGYITFKEYLAPYATTPPVMECKTPKGGLHLYYKKTEGYTLKQLPATLKGVDIQAGVNNYSILYFDENKKLIVEPDNEASPELLEKLEEYQNGGKMEKNKGSKKRKKSNPSPILNGSKFHRVSRTGRILKTLLNPTVKEKQEVIYLKKLAQRLSSFGLGRKPIKELLSIANNKLNVSETELNNIVSAIEPNNELNRIGRNILKLLNPPFGAGQRNDKLISTSGSLYRYGLDSNEVWYYLNLCNNKLAQPVGLKEITTIFNNASAYQVA